MESTAVCTGRGEPQPNGRMEPAAPACEGSRMFVNERAARRSLRAARYAEEDRGKHERAESRP